MINRITAIAPGAPPNRATNLPATPVPLSATALKANARTQSVLGSSPAGRFCNQAAAGLPMDITIPDGTRLEPGQSFSKTWRLVNLGHCTWTNEYSLMWFSGNSLGSPGSQALRSEVAPAESVDITIDLVAPQRPGIYQGNWMLKGTNGEIFGIGPDGRAPFWVKIEVIQLDTATPTSAPSPSATSMVYRSGSAQLAEGDYLDLDSGLVGSGNGEDLAFSINNLGKMVLQPAKGTYLAYVGDRQPDEISCRGSALSDQPVGLEGLGEGAYLCYRTNQTLPGYLQIIQFDVDRRILKLQLLTWFIP
jgi:hypothetical protein